MRIRPELPDDKILDVYCADLVRDPIKEMHRVYEWLGEELDPATEKSMRAWIDTDNQRQQARPTYSLEDYGWTHESVAPYFEEYLDTYPQARNA